MLNLNNKYMAKSEFGRWLENYFLDWQKTNGRSSIRKFSRWLGIHYSLVDQWMNGKGGKPGPKNLAKLALKIGPEVYDLLEIPEPPKFMQLYDAHYDDLPPEAQKQLDKRISDDFLQYLKS